MENEDLDRLTHPTFQATGTAAGRVGRGNSKSIFTENPPKISQGGAEKEKRAQERETIEKQRKNEGLEESPPRISGPEDPLRGG